MSRIRMRVVWTNLRVLVREYWQCCKFACTWFEQTRYICARDFRQVANSRVRECDSWPCREFTRAWFGSCTRCNKTLFFRILTMTIMTFCNWTAVHAAPACALSHKSSWSRVRGPPNVKKYNTALMGHGIHRYIHARNSQLHELYSSTYAAGTIVWYGLEVLCMVSGFYLFVWFQYSLSRDVYIK